MHIKKNHYPKKKFIAIIQKKNSSRFFSSHFFFFCESLRIKLSTLASHDKKIITWKAVFSAATNYGNIRLSQERNERRWTGRCYANWKRKKEKEKEKEKERKKDLRSGYFWSEQKQFLKVKEEKWKNGNKKT